MINLGFISIYTVMVRIHLFPNKKKKKSRKEKKKVEKKVEKKQF